jgi:hypothetical protein
MLGVVIGNCDDILAYPYKSAYDFAMELSSHGNRISDTRADDLVRTRYLIHSFNSLE